MGAFPRYGSKKILQFHRLNDDDILASPTRCHCEFIQEDLPVIIQDAGKMKINKGIGVISEKVFFPLLLLVLGQKKKHSNTTVR